MLNNLREVMRGGVEYSLLRLWSGRLSEAEAAAMRSRAKIDPAYREELLGALAVHARMEGLAGDSAIAAIADEPAGVHTLRRSKRRVSLGLAAGVALAVASGLLYFADWNAADAPQLEKHFTRVGEQKAIELADGSVVTLNTAGQLLVDYSAEQRRVLLERGEAFFEVADDPERPFKVELGVRSVTALGTAFNVRKQPGQYSVAVLEGVVVFHDATAESAAVGPPFAIAGQAPTLSAVAQRRVETGWVAELDLSSNEVTVFKPQSMEGYAGWRSGLLKFYREPLVDVVKELNRYTRRKILIEDAGVMDLHVYAAVSVTELESALLAFEKLLPIKVTRHYDRIVISGAERPGTSERGGAQF
ncbi:FecR family protein [Candidatus Foliamicus sp.]